MRCVRAVTAAGLAGSLGALIAPTDAVAQSRWLYSITAPANLERDSNRTMSVAAPTPITLVRLSPDLHALYKADRQQFELDAGVDLERSSDARVSGNRSDPRIRADWRLLSPTASYGMYVVAEQRAYRAVDVVEQVPLGVDGTRSLFALGGTWSATISETTSATAELREDRERFHTPSTPDYQLTAANTQ